MNNRSIITTLIVCLFVFSGVAQNKKGGGDHFAQIGNREQGTRLHLLEDKLPPVLPDIYLPEMKGKRAAFKPMERMDTKEELQKELARMRKKFVPFLNNYAPQLKEMRKQLFLKEFNWRIETQEDQLNFCDALKGKGEWTTVKVPHYGPPEGRATTYYYKEFKLTQEMLGFNSQFICFKGVDYRAKVFVNGALVGEHEGFFAPFEFNITKYIKHGMNTLLVKVENDFSTLGSPDGGGEKKIGNKIYAASGLGWDNPDRGWHHCPPGMGIYQDCYIESRNPIHLNDVFVRPMVKEEAAEVWVEVNNFHENFQNIKLRLSVYGQNFQDTVLKDFEYIPSTTYIPGVGDLAKPQDWEKSRLHMGYGINYLKIKLPIKSPKLWNNETPYLYQLQTEVLNEKGEITDTRATSFGMRSFTQDTVSIPRGQMYLNGEKVRLRGANTMGFLQLDVKNKNWKQLIDDILLAKICNLNFIRLTQRPVQPEIYEYCNQLGMMLQTDLPLFGSLRPNLFAEGVKQAGEMERLVRNHPSNILVTYINERFPNGEGQPQRNMSNAEDYYRFFKACDQVVHHWNPDRVTKAGDGDYDPPSPGLPDSHCYNTWYNGHGLGLGELHKGYWQKVKPGWFYGCGEFGAEGFDSYDVMKKYWPKSWLPTDESKQWWPDKVVKAQTYRFHYMWYPTPVKLKDWIEASQDHQAWATRLVTEAFRRDTNMMSFAIHLFIDAWPAGWMKAIMDVDRNPKKAFFVYRDALAPLMANLRTDRHQFYEGEDVNVEAWLCNDLNTVPEKHTLKWQLEKGGRVVFASHTDPDFPVNSSKFQGYIKFKAPKVSKRTQYKLRLALFDEKGKGVSESLIDLDVFPQEEEKEKISAFTPSSEGKAEQLLKELNIGNTKDLNAADVILIDDITWYQQNKERLDRMVEEGKTVVFQELPAGEFSIGESRIAIEKTIMGQYYFVSPQTGHTMVKDFRPFDFKFWYNDAKGLVTPFLGSMVKADPAWKTILKTGKTTWVEMGGEYAAVSEMKQGKGAFRICQLQLNNRIHSNPVAKKFALKLLGL